MPAFSLLQRPDPAELAPSPRPARRWVCQAVACLLLGSAAFGQAELWTLDGPQEGSFGGWSGGRPVLDGAPAPVSWLALRMSEGLPPPPGPPAPWTLELVNGSLLPGAPGLGDGDRGSWRLPNGVALDFDTLWLRRAGRRLPVLQVEDKDLLWLRTPGGEADRLRGWLLAWNPGGAVFEGPAGEAEYPWERVQALEVLAEAPPARTGEGWAWLCFRGGGSFLARPLDGAADRPLRAETPWGTVVDLPWTSLSALYPAAGEEFLDQPWQVLASPASEVLDWSPKRGRSVEGRALKVAGVVFPDGLGLRAPVVSWGVLLSDAQDVKVVLLYPWLLIPGLLIILVVLAFNFLGDGLRDAADPYR